MAIKLFTRYPGRADPASSDYPQGSFKNRSAPGVLDGTPLEKDWANDIAAFFQSLIKKAGITPNDVVDKVGASQYFNALNSISGIPEWSNLVDYTVPSLVFGSDDELYIALLASGPSTAPQNPASAPTYWELFNSGITQAQADARYMGKGYMMVRDEKATGTSGGNTTGAVQTRALNTTSSNTIAGASLNGSNQIVLPAGTYRINASAPFFNTDQSKVYLYNVTDTANTIVGTNSDTAGGVQALAFINGRFTIAATKTFEVRCISSASTGALGEPANRAGLVEVYTQVEIFKEA